MADLSTNSQQLTDMADDGRKEYINIDCNPNPGPEMWRKKHFRSDDASSATQKDPADTPFNGSPLPKYKTEHYNFTAIKARLKRGGVLKTVRRPLADEECQQLALAYKLLPNAVIQGWKHDTNSLNVDLRIEALGLQPLYIDVNGKVPIDHPPLDDMEIYNPFLTPQEYHHEYEWAKARSANPIANAPKSNLALPWDEIEDISLEELTIYFPNHISSNFIRAEKNRKPRGFNELNTKQVDLLEAAWYVQSNEFGDRPFSKRMKELVERDARMRARANPFAYQAMGNQYPKPSVDDERRGQEYQNSFDDVNMEDAEDEQTEPRRYQPKGRNLRSRRDSGQEQGQGKESTRWRDLAQEVCLHGPNCQHRDRCRFIHINIHRPQSEDGQPGTHHQHRDAPQPPPTPRDPPNPRNHGLLPPREQDNGRSPRPQNPPRSLRGPCDRRSPRLHDSLQSLREPFDRRHPRLQGPPGRPREQQGRRNLRDPQQVGGENPCTDETRGGGQRQRGTHHGNDRGGDRPGKQDKGQWNGGNEGRERAGRNGQNNRGQQAQGGNHGQLPRGGDNGQQARGISGQQPRGNNGEKPRTGNHGQLPRRGGRLGQYPGNRPDRRRGQRDYNPQNWNGGPGAGLQAGRPRPPLPTVFWHGDEEL
ncbi:hypothetical protein CC78DRAFT_569975 [Lojkania enalia]|uniref:Uncharacterized protein n=1 Tax=Lojkania enalia TaxID=147567 RepID=A0A9P4N239_9PLEO|nr:hypothetical protein CC78DRAFT_569975 [Didymosphaeria enalia]